jgi:hypothetical protein
VSVRPVTFNADGSIDVYYDEGNHEGTIPAAEVAWVTKIDGSHDHNFIELYCPDGCGAVSTWPVGGGADATMGQQMFVQKTERDGCACGNVDAGRSDSVPEAHVHLNCSRMDGPGRWHLGTAQIELRAAQGPQTFQVVYRQSDRLIVGESPRGGVGPDHGVSVIRDMAQYEVLLRTDPAYLSGDGQHILGTSPV